MKLQTTGRLVSVGGVTNLPSTEHTRVGAILSAAALGFGLGEVLAMVLITLGVAIVHGVGGLSPLVSSPPATWWTNSLGLLGLWLGMLGAVYWAAQNGAMAWRFDAWRRAGWRDLGFVVVGVVVQVVVDGAYRPFHVAHLNAPVQRLFGSTNAVTFFFLAVLTGMVAPVVEECFFRATVFRALRIAAQRTLSRGATAVAVITSALLFALAHGEIPQIPGLFFIGAVLAIIYARTERIWPCVLAHVGFNMTTVGLLAAQRFGH